MFSNPLFLVESRWILAITLTIDPKHPPYLPIFLLVASLLVGVAIAYRLWQEAREADEPVSPEDLLAEFREARESGELDEAEFRRVTELLRNPSGANRDAAPARPRNPQLPSDEQPAGVEDSSAPEVSSEGNPAP